MEDIERRKEIQMITYYNIYESTIATRDKVKWKEELIKDITNKLRISDKELQEREEKLKIASIKKIVQEHVGEPLNRAYINNCRADAVKEIIIERIDSLLERGILLPPTQTPYKKPKTLLDEKLLREFYRRGYNMSRMAREFNLRGIEVSMPTVKARLKDIGLH